VKGKKVFIGAVQEPFTRRESDDLIHQLYQNFRKREWHADIFSLPFRWYFRRKVLGQIIGWRLLDLSSEGPESGQNADRIIATRFPSYVVQHPCKIIWFFSHQREIYEGAGPPGMEKETEEGRLRELFVGIDTKSLREAKKVFAVSETASKKLKLFNQIESEVLYPVPPFKEKLRSGRFGDFLLAVGRFEPRSRFDLLLQALASARSPIKCVFAGQGPSLPALKNLTGKLGLTDRVRFALSPSEEDLVSLYSECFAVASVAAYEPAGYRILEAMFAGKPVITVQDAADALEFVVHLETGLVCPPHREALAQAAQDLYDDRIKSHQLGDAGFERVEKYNWDFIMDKLSAVY